MGGQILTIFSLWIAFWLIPHWNPLQEKLFFYLKYPETTWSQGWIWAGTPWGDGAWWAPINLYHIGTFFKRYLKYPEITWSQGWIWGGTPGGGGAWWGPGMAWTGPAWAQDSQTLAVKYLNAQSLTLIWLGKQWWNLETLWTSYGEFIWKPSYAYLYIFFICENPIVPQRVVYIQHFKRLTKGQNRFWSKKSGAEHFLTYHRQRGSIM